MQCLLFMHWNNLQSPGILYCIKAVALYNILVIQVKVIALFQHVLSPGMCHFSNWRITSWFHCILSWQRENQQLSMLMALRSDSTPSRQRFLAPWKGCVLCNSPNRSCLGGLSSLIRPRWPCQRSRLSIIKSATDHCRPNASDKFLVVIRSL